MLHEVNVKAGEVIIRQGETGDCMYLIAAGRVHVYNETQSIAYLEAGGIVGEWAILTAALRSASVAAVEDTRLFRLGQDAFHELMVDRPEVVRGIIQVLCRRFRERVALAPEYQNRGQPLQPIKAQSKDDYAFLLPIEKVIILKTVDLFSQTPYPILAEIASILEEVTFKAGERIIEKGEIGNCMYIIISGQIRVHDGEQTRTYLGERAIFGEFAVLDSEPRTASVTAVEETRLFRIDQDVLYELMADRVEVAQGILRVLCQRVSEWLN
ncbi:MAG: cyclic nucleotide-binding domain-containing protein [Candidatus Poribacteria bacterium]|nr:cyclic nucleotide-binding domain-containing protein [Candidatus Poribacteria bacterium]